MERKRLLSWVGILSLLLLGVPALLWLRHFAWLGSAAGDPSIEATLSAALPNLYGYVTNIGEDTVSVIDLVDHAELERIPVGQGPYKVALSPDERWALVTNSYTNTVSFIDTALNQEVDRVRVGSLPRGLAVSPSGLALVANSGEASLSVIDLETRTVITTVTSFPSNVWDVAASTDGRYAYLSNEGGSGDIYRVDTHTWAVSALISGVPGCGAGLALAPGGAYLYAADPCRRSLRVVDIAQGTWEEYPLAQGQGAWDVALHPLGGLVFVSNEFLPPPGLGRDTISFIETGAHAEIHLAPVGSAPLGMAVSGNGKRLYVANWGDDTVSVLDTDLGQVIGSIPVGQGPWGIALKGQALIVSKTVWQDPLPVGWANHYEIRVRNSSVHTVRDVILQDPLPAGLQFLGTMETGGTYDAHAHLVMWQLGDLDPGEERLVRLRFRASSGMQVGESVINHAFASSREGLVGHDWEQVTFSQPPVPTDTWTPVWTGTATPSPSPTSTVTPTPSSTWTPTASASPSATITRTPKAATATPTATETSTATPSATTTAVDTPMPGSIQALAWFDLDGDGQWGPNEPALTGVRVLLSDTANNTRAGVTDVQGQAFFGTLSPGDYLVRAEELAGHFRTTPHSIKLSISSSGQVTVIFGYRLPPLYLPAILATE